MEDADPASGESCLTCKHWEHNDKKKKSKGGKCSAWAPWNYATRYRHFSGSRWVASSADQWCARYKRIGTGKSLNGPVIHITAATVGGEWS